jgi:hypothetical protein
VLVSCLATTEGIILKQKESSGIWVKKGGPRERLNVSGATGFADGP